MKHTYAIGIVLWSLSLAASPAGAQTGPATPPGAKSLDALADVLDRPKTARGIVVEHREGTLVLRGDDGRLVRVNSAGLDAGSIAQLKEGRYVTVTVKDSLTPGAMPIAASVEAGDIQPSAAPR